MAEVVDLRGRQPVPAAPPVLADPSGRRARLLRRGGRVVAIVFSAWLIGLVLAGLGILPSGALPLSQFAGASPPAIRGPIHVAAVSRSDQALAQPLATKAVSAQLNTAAAPRSSIVASVPSPHTGSGTGNRRAATPNGGSKPVTKPGTATHTGSGAVKGGAGTTTTIAATGSPTGVPVSGGKGTTHGKSGVAPGQVKQTTTTTPSATTTTTATTTTPGNSGTAPGQTVTTPGHGHRG